MNREVSSIAQEKKKLKENQMFNAAYDLFLENGIEKTSIDDIVKRAGVAKGTFYLYFKDKYDLLNRLALKKSNKIIKDALDKTNDSGCMDFRERTLIFIDYLIDYLKDNKSLLNIIKKNISWGVYGSAIMNREEYEQIQTALNIFIKNITQQGMSHQEAEMTLFMIIELIGSICYTTIILEEPTDIDTIKPVLLKKILAMIQI